MYMREFRNLIRDERGQATIEWTILALAMALIAMWIVISVAPVIREQVLEILDQLRAM